MGPGRGNDIGASPFRADLNKYSLESYRAIWMSKTLSRKQDFSYFSLASARVVCNLREGPRQSEDMSMPMSSAPSDDQNARNSRGHTASRVRCILAFKLRWCWIPARWHVWIICVALLLITARAISEKTWKDDITKEKEVWIHKPSSPLNTSC